MSFTLDRSYVRKTVSITLAFIMVFGSVSFAIPPLVPEAHADNTGSISLDRTVFPVPWGVPANYAASISTTPSGRSLFPIHQLGMDSSAGLNVGEFIANGTTRVHIRVFDADLNLNSTSVDNLVGNINVTSPSCTGLSTPYPHCIGLGLATVGNVKIILSRPGVGNVTLGYAGGPTWIFGLIDVNDDDPAVARQFGPIPELAPNAGVFEFDLPILSTDGPSSASCPVTLAYQNATGHFVPSELVRFDDSLPGSEYYCILAGDILITEYTDLSDATNGISVVSDTSSFDLRDGAIQTDKLVYNAGNQITLTLIEPDFNLDSDFAESYDLDLIGWTMSGFAGNGNVTLGDRGGNQLEFATTGKVLQETGASTGIFQTVIIMPTQINGTFLLPNQTVTIEFNDWGNSLASFVGSSLLNTTHQIFVSPLVVNDHFSTQVDTPLNDIPVLNNDAGDGGITILNVTAPINGGTAVVNGTSNGIDYTPASGFRGVDRFTYSGLDGFGDFANGDVEVAVLGTNGKIAFQSNRDGNNEVYIMNSDGIGQTRLTNNAADDGVPAWSPDGTKIAFRSNRDGNYEIYAMNADGTGQMRLTNSTTVDADPAWSPDGTKIAFRSNRDGNFEIYTMNADGTDPTNTSNNLAQDYNPSWSPDGTKITFYSDRDGNFEIYTMNADGTDQTNISNNVATDYQPSWSPDGTKIAFSSFRDGNFEIYTMNADGTDQTNISNNAAVDFNSKWSPDGTKITFYSDRDGNFEIYTMNADGTDQTNISNNSASDNFPDWGTSPNTLNSNPIANDDSYMTQAGVALNNLNVLANDTDADFDMLTVSTVGSTLNGGTAVLNGSSTGINYSPPAGFRGVDGFHYAVSDGNGGLGIANVTIAILGNNGKITFSSFRDGNQEIYVMNSDGSAQTNISNNPALDLDSTWSPDGTKIAFESNRDGNLEIYTMNADGSAVTRLTNETAGDAGPSWSPNGTKIAFQSTRDGIWNEIYVMNSDGSGQTRLTVNQLSDDQRPNWSPNGTKIAFDSGRDGDDEIYVMNTDGSAVTRLTNNPAADFDSSWSPDGTKIAFTSQRDGDNEIYIMNSDGSGQTRLTNDPNDDRSARWSPDGTKIIFYSNRDDGVFDQVYTMNVDGTGLTKLSNVLAADTLPDWGTAPDTLFGGPVAFDQLSYIIETSGYITVSDPSANLNPAAIDNIIVTLATTSGSNLVLNVPENAVDSGVFVSNMIKFTVGPTTAPTDLHVEPIDEVHATYLANVATASIKLASGARGIPSETNAILFAPGTFQIENGATISVYASSANINNDVQDTITAFVSSSSFPAGLRVNLQEDSSASGIFVNPTLIPLTAGITDYANPKLHVTANDKIFAKYPASGLAFNLRTEDGQEHNTFTVGLPSDIPFAGDWDGDGIDTIALFRPSDGQTFLRTVTGGKYITLSPTTTGAQAGDIPISGDWDGNGIDSVGYFRPSTLTFYLHAENGVLDITLSPTTTGAQAGDIPISGDWNGNGIDSVGYFRPSIKTFNLNDETGSTYNTFTVGLPSDIPFAGDWDGDGIDTIALFRPSDGQTFLRTVTGGKYITLSPTTTGAQAGDIPISGDWDNDANHRSSVGYGRPLNLAATFAQTTVYPIPQEETLIGTYTGPQDALVCDESNNIDGICQAWIEPNVGLAIEVVPGARWTQSCDPAIPGDCPTAGSLDVYVEIDYMTGRQPSQLAIDQVVQAFKDSGVNNGQGINLHVLVDEDIGRFDPLIRLSEVTPGTEPTFDEIKKAFFGTAEERAQGADVLSAKAQVYHYVLWANSLKETPTSSGYAEIDGNDVIITMGAFTDGVGSVEEQAGTLMHELGHNLGLLHGGSDSVNYKPNYLSVMSYQYQFPPNLVPNRPLDYSRQNLTPLIENSLSEQHGIGIVNPDGTLSPATDKAGNSLQAIIGGIDQTGNSLLPIPVPTGQPVDFNRINGFEQSAISQNIHFYDKYDGDDATLQILDGHDDWSNLDLNFRDSATFLSGDIHTDPLVLDEAPIHEITTPDPIPAPDVDTQTPTANAQTIMILPSATDITITLTGADPNLDPLTFAISTPPTSGTLSPITPIDDTSASVTYSAGPARFDSFNFTVNDGTNTSIPANVTIIKNAEPTADSQSVTTGADTPITLTLTGSDADGDSLQFIVPVTPLNGVLGPITQLGTSATIQYTPEPGFAGAELIQFKARDGFEESGLANVAINVIPPASSSTGSSTGTGDVSFETNNGGISDLEAIDPDDPALPAGKPTSVDFEHGLFSFIVSGITPGSAANITITYPSAIPVGSQYWKVAGGAWVNATSLLLDDDGDNILILNITDGGFGDADGAANGQILDPSGVAILEGTTPVAEDQTISVDEDTTEIAITLTATDPQDDPLTFTILGQQNTNLGTIVQDPGSSSVLYLPTPNKNGQDSFTFVANDGTADGNTATITINITPVNDVPVVPPQIDVPVQQDEDKTFIITASDVDTLDENPDSLTFQITSLPTKGSIIAIVAVDATSAQFTYRPNPGVTGDDSFNYHVTDTTNTPSNEGIVLLHIEPIVIPPTPETLQEQKQDVLSQLESIDSDNTRTQKIIQKAVKHITKSTTDELWESDGNSVDSKQGKKVFTEEANGVKKLMKILMTASTDDDDWDEDIDDDEFSDDSDPQTPFETSASITSTVQTVIDTLVNVDRTLAEDAIAQATTHAATLDGKDKKKADKFLEQIEKSIQKAEDKLDEGKFHQGILQYKKAWQSAQSILKLG